MKITEEYWIETIEQLIAGKYNTMGRDFTSEDEEKLNQIKTQILENQKIVDELLKEWKIAEYEEGLHYKNMLGDILTRSTGKDIQEIHLVKLNVIPKNIDEDKK